MSLGDRIKDLRIARGFTQIEIATKLGMGRSNVGHIEKGRVVPTSEDLQKIADILHTTTDFLLGRENAIEPTPSPSWATPRDMRDLKKMLEEEMPMMFDGVPISEDDKLRIKMVMEAMFMDARKKNKRRPIEE